jgi:hypothetical protein
MYAHDASARVKHERAKTVVEGLLRDRSGVVGTQVRQELCDCARVLGHRGIDASAPAPVSKECEPGDEQFDAQHVALERHRHIEMTGPRPRATDAALTRDWRQAVLEHVPDGSRPFLRT